MTSYADRLKENMHYMPIVDGDRGTGRTTLMLEHVKKAALAGFRPVVLAANQQQAAILNRCYAQLGGDPRQVTFVTRVDQTGGATLIYRDHHYIENSLQITTARLREIQELLTEIAGKVGARTRELEDQRDSAHIKAATAERERVLEIAEPALERSAFQDLIDALAEADDGGTS